METKRKKIMIDTRCVEHGAMHGIARHTFELIENILKDELNQKFDFILIVNKKSPLSAYSFPKNFKIVRSIFGIYHPLSQIEIYILNFIHKPNLFHAPHFIVPLFGNTPLIATLHDMNHIALAQNYSLKQKFYYFLLKKKLQYAKKIITVSYFSKNEINKIFSIEDEKIQVIYNGVLTNKFQNKEQISDFQKNEFKVLYNLPQSYLLAIGNNKPHKNLERLLEAFCTGHFPIALVVLSNNCKKLQKIAKKFGKENLVFFLEYMNDDDFPLLYACSEAFIFPSLYEGFGLPPLEAAACGVPVIVSQTTSLPEIMQDCAIYVNPQSSKDIQRGISEALNGDREELKNRVKKGLKRVEQFDWGNMSKETLELYDHLE